MTYAEKTNWSFREKLFLDKLLSGLSEREKMDLRQIPLNKIYKSYCSAIEQYNNLFQEDKMPLRSYDAVQKKVRTIKANLTKNKQTNKMLKGKREKPFGEKQVVNTNTDVGAYFELIKKMPEVNYDDPDKFCLSAAEYLEELSRAEDLYSVKSKNAKLAGAIYRAIQEYIDLVKSKQVQSPKVTVIPQKKSSNKNDNQSLVVLFSDWHIGKIVKDSNGNVVYNTSIAAERIQQMINNFVKIFRRTVADVNIDEIVVILAGDIVDGETVYATQVFHSEGSVLQQITTTANIFNEIVLNRMQSLLAEYKMSHVPIRVIGVKGNHGNIKNVIIHPESSWDLITYKFIELSSQLSGAKNVSFQVALGDYAVCDIKGHKGYIRHRIPKQVTTHAQRSRVAGWENIHKYDFVCAGHFHSYKIENYQGKPIFLNGSLVGADDLAETLSYNDEPCQWVFGVDVKRTKTFIYLLDCKQ